MLRGVIKYAVSSGTRFFSDDAAKRTGGEVAKKVFNEATRPTEEIMAHAEEEIVAKTAGEVASKATDEKVTENVSEKVTENAINHPELGKLYGPYVRPTPTSTTKTEEVVAFQPEFKKSGIGTDTIGKFFDFLTPNDVKTRSQVFYSKKPHTGSLMDTPTGSTVKWDSNQSTITNFHPAVTVEQGKPNVNDPHLVNDVREKISSGIPRLPESLHSIYNQTLDSLLPARKPKM